ncbi:MAG: hypothetical protein FWC17_04675, partial [Treponema sp.]|nr:hypothetical protein [Treponema sp.]
MSFLEINKNILIKKYPGLYEEISSGDMCSEDASCNDLKIEITPSGDPTLCADGIYVHSKREPLREGQRLAQSAEGCGPVVILGFGLGYSAAAAAASGRPVIIVEKSKKILLKAFECRDFSGFLSDNS